MFEENVLIVAPCSSLVIFVTHTAIRGWILSLGGFLGWVAAAATAAVVIGS